MTTILIIGGVILVLALIGGGAYFLLRGGSAEDKATQTRLDQFVGGIGQEEKKKKKKKKEKGERRQASKLAKDLDEAMSDRGFMQKMSTNLAQANLQITVTEFLVLNFLSVVVTAALAFFVYFGGPLTPVFTLGGAVVGFFLPRFYLGRRKAKRLKAFNDQLGDSITLMSNGLRSGYSVLQAMESVGKEMPEPIATEFQRVVREIGLGVDNERAMNNMLRRVPSDDLELMVTAINIQAEVGGNLAEILEIIGFVIRERVRIAGEVKTLTAQGMLSGYVISLLPIILGLILFAMNQEYLGRMVFACEPDANACSQPCGWIMMGVAFMLIGAGFVAIQKVVKIEV